LVFCQLRNIARLKLPAADHGAESRSCVDVRVPPSWARK
jgi:hypothetical protein